MLEQHGRSLEMKRAGAEQGVRVPSRPPPVPAGSIITEITHRLNREHD